MAKELLVAAHMYQPERVVGNLEVVPFVNEQIYREVYRPILVESDRLPEAMVFSLFTTLRVWMAQNHPRDFALIVQRIRNLPDREYKVMGDPYLHDILPLLDEIDMEILLAAGKRSFVDDFGFEPAGFWFPEMAVDERSLRMVKNAGYKFTVLMADQLHGSNEVVARIDMRGNGFYVVEANPGWSREVAYNDAQTENGDQFLDWVAGSENDVVLATDGETFGHHKKLRQYFLLRMANERVMAQHGIGLMDIRQRIGQTNSKTRVWDRSAWSCAHGLGRWTGECDCDNPSLEAKNAKKWYYERLMFLLNLARTNLQKIASRSYKKELVEMLVQSRGEIFGKVGFDNWPKIKGDRNLTAYAICLVGLTSCGWFFGGEGRPERLIPEWAIHEAEELLK